MNKSITNALMGIMVKKRMLDIHQPAPVPEWQQPGDPRQAITLDQLLRMSSGLEFEETYAPLHDATNMLYESDDFAAYAARKPLKAQPDDRWSYASGTTNIVSRAIRKAIEEQGDPHYYSFIHKELFDKIGMTSAVLEPDASGTFVGSSYAFATPRDWARFGLLYLQDGVWNGERILPEGWVKYTTTPTAKAPKGEYGAHFWLNAGTPGNPGSRPWPDAPLDTFAAKGFQGQRVVVIPSRKLVLVRFGATSGKTAWQTNRLIRDVLTALPE
jgi:CubicO group peptidase (beta-lactamase class C family)